MNGSEPGHRAVAGSVPGRSFRVVGARDPFPPGLDPEAGEDQPRDDGQDDGDGRHQQRVGALGYPV